VKQQPRKSGWSQIAYYYASILPHWYTTLVGAAKAALLKRNFCCFWSSTPTYIHAISISPPIKVSEFRRVSHHYKGTVNDMFQTLCCNALENYAQRNNDILFNDPQFPAIYNMVGVVNRRPFGRQLESSLKEFALYGTNTNALEFTPFDVPLKETTVAQMQGAFKPVKYGYKPKCFRQLLELANTAPGGIKYVLQETGDASLACFSNFICPNLIPIPNRNGNGNNNSNTNTNNNNNANTDETEADDSSVEQVLFDRNSHIACTFGMAIPAMLPISFTLCTYNDCIRIGILTDTGSIDDPKEIIACLFEEYEKRLSFSRF
jgi:hypothetical protein